MDMQQLTLAEIARALAAKEFSASELSSHLLARIKALEAEATMESVAGVLGVG